MAEDNTVTLTAEQQAAAAAVQAAGGNRVADLDAAAKALAAKAAEDAKTPEQKAADKLAADNAATLAAKQKEIDDAKAIADAKAAEPQWDGQWTQTGNAHADSAIELLKESGVTAVEANDIFKEAIAASDLTKIDWTKLEGKLGKAKTLLVKSGVETYFNTEVKAQNAVKDFAYEQVGGEAGWARVQAWAKKTEAADPVFAAQLEEWRGGLKVGGFAAKAAIKEIKAAYEAAPGNSSLGEAKLERGATTQQSTEGPGLSGLQYYEAMKKAGGDRAPEHVKKQLQAQRAKGRAAGL